jgi:DNA-binding GntR family transcriptional regulator
MDDTVDFGESLSVSNLSEQVYKHVKRLIMTAKLKSGQRIPEKQIAEKLSVSRTPVREALRMLEEDGLVVIEPRRYTKVATITVTDKKYIGQVRMKLDGLAVSLLAQSATPQDCAALKDIAVRCKDFAAAGDFASCFEMDSLFHCELAERSGNPYLADLTRRVDHKVQLLRNLEEISIDQVKQRIELHLPIVQAICDHDAALAEKLMSEHLSGYYADALEKPAGKAKKKS